MKKHVYAVYFVDRRMPSLMALTEAEAAEIAAQFNVDRVEYVTC